MPGEAAVVEQVRTVAERVAGGYGLEIFDVQFRREARRHGAAHPHRQAEQVRN